VADTIDTIDTIGIIGGTGPNGRGLALRLRESGRRVLLGSRDRARAETVVAALPAPLATEPGTIVGVENSRAAREGTVVIVSIPWDGLAAVGPALAADLAGKVVISCANPLRFEGGAPRPVRLPDGSAAQLLQRLCPEARVVSGFQNVSAVMLGRIGEPVAGDVLLCGDDAGAIDLASAVVRGVEGLRPIHAGPLHLSSVAEDLTALLISVNRRYGAHASIVLTGVDTGAEPGAGAGTGTRAGTGTGAEGSAA
jgi:8-hydroxy-5-deazaflavin:NADPH oxidoreductase